jgi:hypothetical protein
MFSEESGRMIRWEKNSGLKKISRENRSGCGITAIFTIRYRAGWKFDLRHHLNGP